MSRLDQKSEFKLRTFEELKNVSRYFLNDEKTVDKALIAVLEEKLEKLKNETRLQNQCLNEEIKRTYSSLKSMGIDLPFSFSSDDFDMLSNEKKIEYIKIVFGILSSDLCGVVVTREAQNAQSYILENKIIDGFSEKVKFELAFEIIKSRGCRMFEHIPSLTDTQKAELTQKAEKEVKAWLPVLPDELINKWVKEQNQIELRYLIYQCFSGKFSHHHDKGPAFLKLKEILEKPVLDFDKCIEALKSAMSENQKLFQNYGWSKLLPTSINYRQPLKWSGKETSEQLIAISHGGGFFHILEFLCGISYGYRIDNYSYYGICVSIDDDRNEDNSIALHSHSYATRTAPNHLDIPAKFTAKIESQYLLAMSKLAEAYISFDSVTHLKAFSLHLYNFQDFMEKLKPFQPQKPLKSESTPTASTAEDSLVQQGIFNGKTQASSHGPDSGSQCNFSTK